MAINLQSIAKTQRASAPPRIVVHGGHGVGKSTLGANAYAPIFLPTEEGLSGLEVNSFPLLRSWTEVQEALYVLESEKHELGTVVVDSLDWLKPLIWAEVCKRGGKKSLEDWGYGKGYFETTPLWREFLDGIDRLRSRGMASILICHSEVKRFDAPDSESYDRYQPKLHKIANALITEWADVIAFAQFEVATKKSDSGFGNTKVRGIGTGRRIMHTVESPAFIAKNRYGIEGALPLEWTALVTAIQGGSDAQAA